jgi:hypothetical protein
MKEKDLGLLLLIAGAGGLAWWFFFRNGSTASSPGGLAANFAPYGPQQGGKLSGGLINTAPPASIDDPAIVAARGAYGEQARCNATGGRFIKTISPPEYGICVDAETFAAWVAAGLGRSSVTIEIVRAWLQRYQAEKVQLVGGNTGNTSGTGA